MSNNSKTVLVIAPHQDDETIGCGGTICRLVTMGYKVKVVHVFRGTSGVPGVSPEESARLRHQEALEAAEIGGYEILENLGFTDRDRKTDGQLQDQIIELIRRVKPTLLFAPHHDETDREHHLVSIATREASWLSTVDIARELGEPIPSAPRTLYYEVWKAMDNPTIISDISEYVVQKQRMLAVFKSQMSQTSWIDGAIGHGVYRGTTMLGSGNVEVFETSGILMEEIL